MHKYLFTVGIQLDDSLNVEVYLDCYYKCQAAGRIDPEVDIVAYLEFAPESERLAIKEDIRAYESISLRARYESETHGVYAIETEEEVDRDMMESIIQQKVHDSTLNNFLKGAKV